MKVRELINSLEKADPELDVFVAPLITLPVLDGGTHETPAVNVRSHIEKVKFIKEMDPLPDGNEFVVLGYSSATDATELPDLVS
jgi:hypothetical protein